MLQELKPNNYLSDPAYDNQFVRVIKININDGNDGRVDEGRYAYDVDLRTLKPITITPELLEKCGAKYIGTTEDVYKLELDGDEYLVIGKMKKDPVFDMFELHFTDNEGGKAFPYTLNPVKYLHQLQNLYFTLTGKELNIQL